MQSLIGGTRTGTEQRSASASRSAPLAATPPATITQAAPSCSAAAAVFAASTSTTASWKRAAVAGTSNSPARVRCSTAVFSPLNEKSWLPRSQARGNGSVAANTSGSASRATRSITGPPGNGSPSSRPTLSNASPAASSRVCPRRSTTP